MTTVEDIIKLVDAMELRGKERKDRIAEEMDKLRQHQKEKEEADRKERAAKEEVDRKEREAVRIEKEKREKEKEEADRKEREAMRLEKEKREKEEKEAERQRQKEEKEAERKHELEKLRLQGEGAIPITPDSSSRTKLPKLPIFDETKDDLDS